MSSSIVRIALALMVAGVRLAAPTPLAAQEYLYVGNSLGGDVSGREDLDHRPTRQPHGPLRAFGAGSRH